MDTKRLAPLHPARARASPAIATAPAAEKRARGRLGVLSLDHRRPHAGWPTPRSTATSRPPTVTAFVERALAFFAAHGISPSACRPTTPGPTSTTARLRELLADRGIAAPPDPAADPQAQRQGRALPADPRPRMGLRTALPQLRRPRRSAAHLARRTTTPPATTARSQTGHPSAAFGTSRGTTGGVAPVGTRLTANPKAAAAPLLEGSTVARQSAIAFDATRSPRVGAQRCRSLAREAALASGVERDVPGRDSSAMLAVPTSPRRGNVRAAARCCRSSAVARSTLSRDPRRRASTPRGSRVGPTPALCRGARRAPPGQPRDRQA